MNEFWANTDCALSARFAKHRVADSFSYFPSSPLLFLHLILFSPLVLVFFSLPPLPPYSFLPSFLLLHPLRHLLPPPPCSLCSPSLSFSPFSLFSLSHPALCLLTARPLPPITERSQSQTSMNFTISPISSALAKQSPQPPPPIVSVGKA